MLNANESGQNKTRKQNTDTASKKGIYNGNIQVQQVYREIGKKNIWKSNPKQIAATNEKH